MPLQESRVYQNQAVGRSYRYDKPYGDDRVCKYAFKNMDVNVHIFWNDRRLLKSPTNGYGLAVVDKNYVCIVSMDTGCSIDYVRLSVEFGIFNALFNNLFLTTAPEMRVSVVKSWKGLTHRTNNQGLIEICDCDGIVLFTLGEDFVAFNKSTLMRLRNAVEDDVELNTSKLYQQLKQFVISE